MSDEPKQPSLRLKPRLKPADAPQQADSSPPSPEAATPPPPEPPAPAPAPLAFKLRAPTLPPTADLPATPPGKTPNPVTETPESRFKLKAKPAEPAKETPSAPAAGPLPGDEAKPQGIPTTEHAHPEGVPPAFLVDSPTPSPTEVPSPPEPPLFVGEVPTPEPAAVPTPKPPPILKPLGTTEPVANKPKVPHFRPSEKINLPKAPEAKAKAGQTERKALKVVGVAALLGTLLLLLGGGYLLWSFFANTGATPPTPVEASATPTVTPSTVPAPVTTTSDVNAAQSTPGKLIQKAQDAVAARREIEQERADAIIEDRTPPEQRGFPFQPLEQAPAPRPTAKESPGPTTYSEIAPGIAATDSRITSSGKPSLAFRKAVSGFIIRGVFQGTPPRAHINGRIVIAGHVVSEELGITFVGINVDEDVLIFQDRSGARVSRRY